MEGTTRDIWPTCGGRVHGGRQNMKENLTATGFNGPTRMRSFPAKKTTNNGCAGSRGGGGLEFRD